VVATLEHDLQRASVARLVQTCIPWPPGMPRLQFHHKGILLQSDSLYNQQAMWNVPIESGRGEGGADVLRVLIVQDHPLLASALATILGDQAGIEVRGIARTGAEAAQMAAQEQATVVLMDFRLPDMSGPAAAGLIQASRPGVAIVFHSAEDSETALLDAIDVGATAYLMKAATADQILEAVRKAATGEVLIPSALFAKAIARQQKHALANHDRDKLVAEFTPRELDVLRLLAVGLDTIDMSARLGIASHTIEWHVRHIIEKLGAHSKLQAVIAAARRGLIEL
jgi:DNA-binding NarL/FixJ family response regulator